MGSHIGRRKFLATLGGAAAAWPLATRAQQPAMPVIGFLHAGSAQAVERDLGGFRDGIRRLGYVEGSNVQFEFRYADGYLDRLPDLERIPLRFEHSLHGERSSCTLLPRNRQRSVRSGAIDAEWCARRPCAGQPSLC
jgi:hypothetical protein